MRRIPGGHPDLPGAELEGDFYRDGIDTANGIVQRDAAKDAQPAHDLLGDRRAIGGLCDVRLEQQCTHAGSGSLSHGVDVICEPGFYVRRRVNVHIYQAAEVYASRYGGCHDGGSLTRL